VFGETPAKIVAGDAGGPRLPDVHPHQRQVRAVAFRCLVRRRGESLRRSSVVAKPISKAVGEVTMPFGSQARQNGSIMGTGDDRMAECQFHHPCQLFVPGAVVAARQDAAAGRINFRHDDMPVTPGSAFDGPLLRVLDNQGLVGVEPKFLRHHVKRGSKLLAVDVQFRGENKMPERVDPSEPRRVGHGIVQVGLRPL
jgi:hypothetical protein